MRSLSLITCCCLLFQIPLFAQNIEIFVSSRATNSVKVWNQNGDYLGDFIAPGSGGLQTTEDIIFHPDGSVLVSGYNSSAIKRYDGLTGAFLGDFSSGFALSNPSKMSIGPDSLIYITQWGGSQKVVRFDLNGNFVDEFTKTAVKKGLGHLWDKDGIFYIAAFDQGTNGFIEHFDTSGISLGAYLGSAKMDGPTTIWLDADSNLYINDWTKGSVLYFDTAKNYLGDFITANLVQPEGIAFAPNGNLFIGDWTLDKVQRFDSTGAYLYEAAFGNSLQDPNAVKVRASRGLGKPESNFGNWEIVSHGKQVELRLESIGESQELAVNIFSLDGRLVFRKTGLDNPFINLNKLANGNYIISLEQKGFRDSKPFSLQD